MSALPTILKKIEALQMAIEAIEVLVKEFDDKHLVPTFNYLREQKQLSSVELSEVHNINNIDVQYEELSRLSHI
jgi:hypothetical protein